MHYIKILDGKIYLDDVLICDLEDVVISSDIDSSVTRGNYAYFAMLHGLAECDNRDCFHDCPVCERQGKSTGLSTLLKTT